VSGEVRALAPTGVLGGGFREQSLKIAMSWKPDFIGCDAGSTDGGPYYLGSGTIGFSLASIRRDLDLLIGAAREAGIPLLVGSAATGGADAQLEQIVKLAVEVASKRGLHFRLGVIHSEPSRSYLLDKYRGGLVRALANAPPINESTFERSARIVAVAGAEPFQMALDQGCDVVICGRSSDTSIFAAVPTMRGIPPGPAWHAAKILECGAAAVEQRKYSDPLFAWIRDDHFVVEPPNPDYRCTPMSVASHNLYENSSPFRLVEPAGTIVTDEALYEAVNDRAVKVSGSRYLPAARYTVKLEGAELVGYRSMFMGGIRDPLILRQLDAWQAAMLAATRTRFEEIYGPDINKRVTVNVRRYGIDGAMGVYEPTPNVHHEVGLVIEVTAPDQELAHSLTQSAEHIAIHYAIPEWTGLITTLAIPYSPAVVDLGPVYRFTLNHVLELDDPLEPFRVETRDV
jgi:hypothetical protein